MVADSSIVKEYGLLTSYPVEGGAGIALTLDPGADAPIAP